MIAEQPPSREPDLSRKKGLHRQAWGKSWLDAKLDAVSSDAMRFRWFMIVSGLAALVWVGFLGTVLLRSPAASPAKVADLPPLVSATPPALPAGESSSQTTGSDPTPFGSDPQQSVGDEALPRAPQQIRLPPAHKTTGNSEAPPAGAAPKSVAAPKPPPAKPVTVTIRTFHPPVIPSGYKDMVADKMREMGLDRRLEAKVRSGQQLSKEDMASIPKSVMEKMNGEVVAYGQPPLYTDATTTVTVSAAH